MAVARRLVSLGRAARAEAGVKVRQPLRRALIFLAPGAPRPPAGIVEDELNVDRLEYGSELSDVLTYELVPNFRTVGPRLGEAVKELRAALAGLDPIAVAAALEAGAPGRRDPLERRRRARAPRTLELRVRAEGGFAISRDGAEVVALDLELTDDLRRRGLLRDLVRQVQDLRKSSGFDVADRIALYLTGCDDLATGFDELAARGPGDRGRHRPGRGRGRGAGARRRARRARLGRRR